MAKFDLQIDGKNKSITKGNTDWYYGGGEEAWTDLASAKAGVPSALRSGKTLGVIEAGKIVEYIWHPDNILDSGLLLKTSVVVDTTITNGSNNPVSSDAVYDALLLGSAEAKTETIVVALSDLVTNLTTGTNKAYFRMPYTATVIGVKASVLVAQTSGSILTFDIQLTGSTILSTKITIDNNEKTSVTATTPAVLATTVLTQDGEITFNIDQVGTVGAKGAIITLTVVRA